MQGDASPCIKIYLHLAGVGGLTPRHPVAQCHHLPRVSPRLGLTHPGGLPRHLHVLCRVAGPHLPGP